MRPTIEAMAEGDVEVIARLRLEAFFEGTGRTLEEDMAGLRGLIARDGFEAAFVARDRGRPVGSCLLVRDEIDSPHDLTPWLAGLIVKEAYRGSGVGTALVRTVEAHAASAGVGCSTSIPGRRAASTKRSDGRRSKLSSRTARRCS